MCVFSLSLLSLLLSFFLVAETFFTMHMEGSASTFSNKKHLQSDTNEDDIHNDDREINDNEAFSPVAEG